MAAIPVTISGVLFDKKNRTTENVTLIGFASITGLSVGGGPIIPEEPDKPPTGEPPGIWQDPGGYNPDNPGQPWPPEKPPTDERPPLIEWKAVWDSENGWQIVGTPNVPHPTPSKK